MANIFSKFLVLLITWSLFSSCSKDEGTTPPVVNMQISALRVGTQDILSKEIENAPFNKPIIASFTASIDRASVAENIELVTNEGEALTLTFSYLDNDKTVSATPSKDLNQNTFYTIRIIDGIKGTNGEIFPGIEKKFRTENPPFKILKVSLDENPVDRTTRIQDIGYDPKIEMKFSEPIKPSDVSGKAFLQSQSGLLFPQVTQLEDSTLQFQFADLASYQRYQFFLPPSIVVNGKQLEAYSFQFYTQLDDTPKFPTISEEELLTKVQEQTFKYFWDFGHPVSGLARERNSSGNTVTIGGSGFGVMAIIVGIERGFITRGEGVDRLEKIVSFLLNDADRFHGVWSHWLNGNTGDVIPFSADDDGGDLVETSFMVQALITARQYLEESNTQESAIITKINTLWNEVEWDWHLQTGDSHLTWHWSPNFGFQKNLPIRGWNESLIVYVLAASSPTYTIDKSVYTDGWARSGGMVNGNSYYDITLPLGSNRGGPLFFSHYSFLGLDPRNLVDTYANYWEQNVAHSKINYAYCVANPFNFVGYSADSWGLTASDNHEGYSAHSPTNDLGVITPTAAISSIPYTPEESMDAIKQFYYLLGDKMWGEYGFYDAFNVTEGWYAKSYLAIDQGPIICMIENHRSGLLWNLFMSAPEVQDGLNKLNFTY